MPLWLIYHPEGTFVTPESKQALAADITQIYVSTGLPAFYVSVNYITLPSQNMFVGGQSRTSAGGRPYIRISVDHIAVHMGDDAERHRNMVTRVDAVLKPYVADKGYDWEFHIDETPRGLWKINGFIPPPCK
ncbi:putative oxalocrotonate tautomerase [Diplogelasinospora grovesii]|uniref:Oxalocrotonate tautomerase n=1 Tax=Diplogelasinospora grovesii TaxID=303347 RepID=A0AAN6MXF7_9PEZI|nr:putative oxalocrotonate tautomerase [Diplogelasinospora grovesii]